MSAWPQPNIVLLTIDCWRGDCLGARDGTPSPTPHLDCLAAEGTVFQQAITCGGWTRPAMMALFSSVYASRHYTGPTRGLSPDLPVLTEVLQSHGYETAGFTTNLLCGRSGGFERGFDTFADLRSNQPVSALWLKHRHRRGFTRVTDFVFSQPVVHRLLHWLRAPFTLPEITAPARQLTDELVSWLDKGPRTPFFLWAHYIDLHWPYRLSRRLRQPREIAQAWRDRKTYRQVVSSRGRFDAGPEARERWQTLYREELLTVDEQIVRLLTTLQDRGLWNDTIVVVTSDHGEEFYERGTWAHSWNQLFDEGTRVPLIVGGPGIARGRAVDQQVSLLDVAPTLLDLARIEPPAEMLGVTLAPLLNGSAGSLNPTPVRPEAIIEMLGHRNSYRYRMAIRTESARYIHDIDAPHDNLLFDRSADPQEAHDSYVRSQKAARRFDELRFAHMAPIVPDLLTVAEPEAFEDEDPLVVERLRALGYIS